MSTTEESRTGTGSLVSDKVTEDATLPTRLDATSSASTSAPVESAAEVPLGDELFVRMDPSFSPTPYETDLAKRAAASNGGASASQKRGRKPKDWYAVNNKMPGFSVRQGKKNSVVMVRKLDKTMGLGVNRTKENDKKKKPGSPVKKAGSGNKARASGTTNLSGSAAGPPTITTKDILNLVFLDHNYCQVMYSTNRSKVQPTRFLFGPKDGYKAKFFPETAISPNKFLPPVPFQNARPSTPPTSKLEYYLKKGSPLSPVKRPCTPVKKCWEPHAEEEEEEIDVDVVTVEPETPIPYDPAKARNLMTQCEKHSMIMKPLDADDKWESQIVRTGWTKVQTKLFDGVMKALHNERLARLAYIQQNAEPVLRRASLDKAARHFRMVLNEVNWNTKLTQWLHDVLIDSLSQPYLSAYLDILQTLKSKVPTLINRMIYLSTAPKKIDPLPMIESLNDPAASIEGVLSSINVAGDADATSEESKKHAADALKEVLEKKANHLNADALNLLLKKKWDPFSPVVHHSKLKTLACNPVFLYIPSGSLSASSSKRFKNFSLMFASLGKVIPLNLRYNHMRIPVAKYAQKILNSAKNKIDEIRQTHPDRPIYIIGWGTGAVIAATVSVSHPVDGVIAIAFPLLGLAGPRGSHDLEDPILDMKCPTMFVIGGRATDSNVTDMELLRKQLNCESSMVIVGCGDHNLRVSRYHRQKLLVTQSYIDKCIVDEIKSFINLHSKHYQVSAAATTEKSNVKPAKKTSTPANQGNLPRNRTSSTCSNSSIPVIPKPSPSVLSGGISDCSMDSSLFDSSSLYDDTSFGATSVNPPKCSDSLSASPTKDKKKKTLPSEALSMDSTSGDGTGKVSHYFASISESKMKTEKGNDVNSVTRKSDPVASSPVMQYLGQPTGPSLLHGLLSPPSVSSPVTVTAAPNSPGGLAVSSAPVPNDSTSNKTKKKTPKKRKSSVLEDKPIDSSSTPEKPKRKRPPRPKKPKKAPDTTPNPSSAESAGSGATILAGGATATPVSVPATPSMDTLRNFVLQHQHQQVIQQHLQQLQQQGPPSFPSSTSQSQLYRLLSPPTVSSVGNLNAPGSSMPSFPVTLGSLVRPDSRPGGPGMKDLIGTAIASGTSPTGNQGVFPIAPTSIKAGDSQQTFLYSTSTSGEEFSQKAVPQTVLISRQQLVSNLSANSPIIRITKADSVGPNASPISVTAPVSMAAGSSLSVASSNSGPHFLTSAGTSVLAGLSGSSVSTMPLLTPNAKANVILQGPDKSMTMTNLEPDALKALFEGGVVRFVVPGEGGKSYPLTIALKHSHPLSTTTADESQLIRFPGSAVGLQQVGTLGAVSFSGTMPASLSSSSSSVSNNRISVSGLSGLTLNTASGGIMATKSSPGTTNSSAIKVDTTKDGVVPNVTFSALSSQTFGQVYRQPVTTIAGSSGSQLPVSVVMPKSFVPTTIAPLERASGSSDSTSTGGILNVKPSITSNEPGEKERSYVTHVLSDLNKKDTSTQAEVPLVSSVTNAASAPAEMKPYQPPFPQDFQVGKPIQITSDTTAVPCSSPVTKDNSFVPSSSTKKIDTSVKLELKGMSTLPVLISPSSKAVEETTPSGNAPPIVLGTDDVSITLKSSADVSAVDTGIISDNSDKPPTLKPKSSNPKPKKIQQTPKSNKKKEKTAIEDLPVELPATSTTSISETPPKRDKKKQTSGGSSDGNSDDAVTPRLTRSMRRQSSNSGGN